MSLRQKVSLIVKELAGLTYKIIVILVLIVYPAVDYATSVTSRPILLNVVFLGVVHDMLKIAEWLVIRLQTRAVSVSCCPVSCCCVDFVLDPVAYSICTIMESLNLPFKAAFTTCPIGSITFRPSYTGYWVFLFCLWSNTDITQGSPSDLGPRIIFLPKAKGCVEMKTLQARF